MSSNLRLVPKDPAPEGQVRRAVKSMGKVAGILRKLRSRDLRRGSARDLAHLSKSVKGVVGDQTAAGLGHTKITLARGTTERYAGGLQEDLLTLRADDSFQDRLAPKFNDPGHDEILPQVRAKKISTREINERLQRDGFDAVESSRQLRLETADVIRREKGYVEPLKRRLPWPSALPPQKRLGKRSSIEVLPDSPATESSNAAVFTLTSQPSARQPLRELSPSELNTPQVSVEPFLIDPGKLHTLHGTHSSRANTCPCTKHSYFL